MKKDDFTLAQVHCSPGAPATHTAVALPGWPAEPWDAEIPVGRIESLFSTQIPGDIFAVCAASGFERLLAQNTQMPAGREGFAFSAVGEDGVLRAAVATVQAQAYEHGGSKVLAILAGARFLCLVVLHRQQELFPLFPKDGEDYEAATPHWSFVAAAAMLDLNGYEADMCFDPDQMRFLAMCCADFDNPWSTQTEEPMH